jgi:hypothetical protein
MVFVHRGQHARTTPRVAPYSPLLSLAPWLPAAGAAVALGATAGLTGRDLAVAPISLVLFGAWTAGRSALARHRARTAADAWIVRGHDNAASWYGWRIGELTAPRERRLLARSLRDVAVEAASRRPSTVTAPVNRIVVRPNIAALHELADRLAALDRPVRALGVLKVHALLTSPGSPLYARPLLSGSAVLDCSGAIGQALDDLEVH